MKYNKSVSDKVVEQLSGLSDWMTSEFDAESDRVYYEHANYITKFFITFFKCPINRYATPILFYNQIKVITFEIRH